MIRNSTFKKEQDQMSMPNLCAERLHFSQTLPSPRSSTPATPPRVQKSWFQSDINCTQDHGLESGSVWPSVHCQITCRASKFPVVNAERIYFSYFGPPVARAGSIKWNIDVDVYSMCLHYEAPSNIKSHTLPCQELRGFIPSFWSKGYLYMYIVPIFRRKLKWIQVCIVYPSFLPFFSG